MQVIAFTGNEDARKFFLEGEMTLNNIKVCNIKLCYHKFVYIRKYTDDKLIVWFLRVNSRLVKISYKTI